jgi:hypothetical protein
MVLRMAVNELIKALKERVPPLLIGAALGVLLYYMGRKRITLGNAIAAALRVGGRRA